MTQSPTPAAAAAEPLPEWTRLPDLAAKRLGGQVLWANDDFFAPKENLIEPAAPVWLEHEYTDRGKWMDGWESRRRRVPGHDSCIVRLGTPGILRGVVVDTAYFRGNYPEHCSLEACAVDGDPSLEQLQDPATEWIEVLPRSPLRGDFKNPFAISSPYRFTHLRLHIYPDGGVARLRVHGEVMPDWPGILARAAETSGGELDLVAVGHGGRWLRASDMFYSSPGNLLMPGRGVRMDDGWETKRRRGPGNDWTVLQLGIAGTLRRALVDTAHFKGNYPDTCSLEVAYATGADGLPVGGRASVDWQALEWREVLPRTKLQADAEHPFELADGGPATHVRFSTYPDGGVSRLRLYGTPSREGRLVSGLLRLDAMLPGQAEAAFRGCCGSPQWAAAMAARRPFATPDELYAAADEEWARVGREQWLAAFASHPQIGERKAEQAQSATARAWSGQEQAGAASAADATREALAAANREYRERFGFIYIVCATGKSGEEMLELCRQRLGNEAEAELRVAAGEQQKITRLRLEKLLLM